MRPWHKWVFDKLYLKVYGPQADPYNDEEARNIIKLLGLSAGNSILDLGCGYGRHCLCLAKSGFRVTGIDTSKILLAEARQEAQKYDLAIEYKKADMRNLPFDNQFDAVVNNYQSFGFFSHEKNRAVLTEVSKSLKPAGKLLIEQVNIFHDVLAGKRNRTTYIQDHNLVSVVAIKTDPYSHRQTYNWKVYDSCGGKQLRDVDCTYYLYTIPELVQMAEQARLRLIGAYNDDLKEYRFTEKGMIVIFEKRVRPRSGRQLA